eukprot:2523200-Pyramimonas_sp.AAC.2
MAQFLRLVAVLSRHHCPAAQERKATESDREAMPAQYWALLSALHHGIDRLPSDAQTDKLVPDDETIAVLGVGGVDSDHSHATPGEQ